MLAKIAIGFAVGAAVAFFRQNVAKNGGVGGLGGAV